MDHLTPIQFSTIIHTLKILTQRIQNEKYTSILSHQFDKDCVAAFK